MDDPQSFLATLNRALERYRLIGQFTAPALHLQQPLCKRRIAPQSPARASRPLDEISETDVLLTSKYFRQFKRPTWTVEWSNPQTGTRDTALWEAGNCPELASDNSG